MNKVDVMLNEFITNSGKLAEDISQLETGINSILSK